jgi:hypothetical protein
MFPGAPIFPNDPLFPGAGLVPGWLVPMPGLAGGNLLEPPIPSDGRSIPGLGLCCMPGVGRVCGAGRVAPILEGRWSWPVGMLGRAAFPAAFPNDGRDGGIDGRA